MVLVVDTADLCAVELMLVASAVLGVVASPLARLSAMQAEAGRRVVVPEVSISIPAEAGLLSAFCPCQMRCTCNAGTAWVPEVSISIPAEAGRLPAFCCCQERCAWMAGAIVSARVAGRLMQLRSVLGVALDGSLVDWVLGHLRWLLLEGKGTR